MSLVVVVDHCHGGFCDYANELGISTRRMRSISLASSSPWSTLAQSSPVVRMLLPRSVALGPVTART